MSSKRGEEKKGKKMWKLFCDRGRQVWKFVDASAEDLALGIDQDSVRAEFDVNKNPNSGDKIYRQYMVAKNYEELKVDDAELDLPKDELGRKAAKAALEAINFYKALQDEDGHWPGDYGGPMFLMPGLIFTCHITGTPLPAEKRKEMVRYLHNHQHKDGGWALHIQGHSTMMGTVLNYVALRVLGESSESESAKRGRKWIRANGGAVGIPSWGKFWLATLGLFEWDGLNSMLPELWLLPTFLPFHPSRFWCHCRMVYLPMAYCYGHRVTGEITPLILELRSEIFTQDYDSIAWSSIRSNVCKIDMYKPHHWLLKGVFAASNFFEKYLAFGVVRKRALDFIEEYINAEDEQTKHVDIGPVNKAINMLCVWHAQGPQSKAFRKHVARVDDYLWIAEDGMKMQGYNGSQLWDTAFATQAIIETGYAPMFPDMIRKAYKYFECAQVREDVPDREKFFRHISNGAWPFSTRDHGWPISDCTAEGLRAVLDVHEHGLVPAKEQVIDDQRIFDAVNVMMSFQNADGGLPTYELQRCPAWLDVINPSEIFVDIISDISYVELTSTVLQALVRIRRKYPEHRPAEIDQAIARGVKFIKSIQRKDGSWYGSWAVCFCYGTWFGVEGLIAAGEAHDSPAVRNACKFLVSKQRADGGWSESYKSSELKEYTESDDSMVVNTGWALLALMRAKYPDMAPIRRGIHFLLSRQHKNGDWSQEAISGVFNGNCMITYTAYRNVFPLWALGRYANLMRQQDKEMN